VNPAAVLGIGAGALVVLAAGILAAVWVAGGFSAHDPSGDDHKPDLVALKSTGEKKTHTSHPRGKTSTRTDTDKKQDVKQEVKEGGKQPGDDPGKQVKENKKEPEQFAQDRNPGEKKQEPGEKKQEPVESKQEEYARLMKAGETALAAKQFDDAIAAFKRASELMPENEAPIARLEAAQKAQVDALVAQVPPAKKPPPDPEKKVVVKQPPDDPAPKQQETFQSYVKAAADALAARNPAAAAQALEAARRLNPQSPVLVDLDRQLNQLALALRNSNQVDPAKLVADFNALVKQGVAARSLGRWDEAVRCFTWALSLSPGDPFVVKALDEARFQQQAAAVRYDQLIAEGSAALQTRRAEVAIDRFQAAGLAYPERGTPLALLQQAVILLDLQRQFAALMDRGNDRKVKTFYNLAIKDYNDALQIFPGDPDALAARADAIARRDAPPTPPVPPPLTAAEKKKRFDAAMTRGRAFHMDAKYALAALEYRAALEFLPNNATAQNLLQRANKSLPLTDPPPADPKVRYQEALKKAFAAHDAGNYAAAVQAYQEAINIMPSQAAFIQPFLNQARANQPRTKVKGKS
jgi:tetratricopeptide (TPR) repeat protein